LGTLVVMAFSRHREYPADAGGAVGDGRANMILALESLLASRELVETSYKSLANLKIAGGHFLMRLLASHPLLEEVICEGGNGLRIFPIRPGFGGRSTRRLG
jgi:heat shock protein HtpX